MKTYLQYQRIEKYQSMEDCLLLSRGHNTHLWADVKFPLKRMLNPLCRSSGEDKAWGKKFLEMGKENKSSLIYMEAGFIRLDCDGKMLSKPRQLRFAGPGGGDGGAWQDLVPV